MMLERQREGIAKAKSAGKYKGRKPIAPERRVLRLAGEGATKISLGKTFYRSSSEKMMGY
jgi:DNA invertase Pin-like site-specific DNA recombinase